MRNDIKIYLTTVQFSSSIPNNELYKVNLFNPHGADVTSTLISKQNITPLITEEGIDQISFTTENLDDDNIMYDNYIIAGDINLQLSNIVPLNCTIGGVTKNYFADEILFFYSDNKFLRSLIQIFYKNNLIFEGLVNTDSYETVKGLDSECELINLEVIAIEKEFRDYYTNINLKDITTLNNLNFWYQESKYNIRYNTAGNYYHPYFKSLDSFLLAIFGINNPSLPYFVRSIDISGVKPPPLVRNGQTINFEWRVSKQAHMFKGQGIGQINPNLHHFIWFLSGYDNFRDKFNCWDFLVKLCKCMGWTFSFLPKNLGNNNYTHVLTLKKRNSVANNITTITKNELLNKPYIKKLNPNEKIYDAIVPAGSFEDSQGDININMYRCYTVSLNNATITNRDIFMRPIKLNMDDFWLDLFKYGINPIENTYLKTGEYPNIMKFDGYPVAGLNFVYNFGKPAKHKQYRLFINGNNVDTINIDAEYPPFYQPAEFCNLIKDENNDTIIKLDIWDWSHHTLTERIMNKKDIMLYQDIEGDKIKFIQQDNTGNNDWHKTDVSGQINQNEILFSGNVGGMLGYFVQPNPNLDEWEILTYRDYVNGYNAACFYEGDYPDNKDYEFIDNFKMLLNKTQYLNPEIKLNVIKNNLISTIVQFEQDAIPQFNGKLFLVTEQTLDLVTDETTLKLVNVN